MDSVDLQVLKCARDWHAQGRQVVLVTVVETWGSAPRPAGALLALRDDGQVVGSVSGGCVEDDLIERIRSHQIGSDKPELVVYGVSKEQAARFGLPCGGRLRIVLERLMDVQWLDQLLQRVSRRELVARTLQMTSGSVSLAPARRGDVLSFDEKALTTVHGPLWRLVIIGAGQISEYLARMALALDYNVVVCDPRAEYANTWTVPDTTLNRGMPDDVVAALELDSHSAVVAVTHDAKLDDLALLEALKSAAFYVGALGSRVNTVKRKERLAEFDLSSAELDRLHGPVGLRIGSKTPPEIAVAILAEMTAVRYGVDLMSVGDKRIDGPLAQPEGPVCAATTAN
ncbi:MAG: XdhC family protein [Betaproteobacteria bacterium]|nr:XdhC family protein [Betaproteobacteria bacterium]